MKKNPSVLIVGAGPVGCVLAERFASQMNWQVNLMEQRTHIAGNCYDGLHESSVMIHEYGPHYFRTNEKFIIDYLSQFTKWIPGNYKVTALHKGQYFPFPINLNTLRLFFRKPDLTETEAEALLQSLRSPIEQPKNSEEFVLSKIGLELYEAFYKGYTIKQWDKHPKDLSPAVCGRIPIRFNTDDSYVDATYQQMPELGFTQMFQNMIAHPNIKLSLQTEFDKNLHRADIIIYTGAIDAYFDFCFGKLEWRSIRFEAAVFDTEWKQPNVQINYPNDFDFTRSVEIKHVTQQKSNKTVVVHEYPTHEGEPFYPMPNVVNEQKYQLYKNLAETETQHRNVHFCGRLAEYTYYNTDEVISKALTLFKNIQAKYAHP